MWVTHRMQSTNTQLYNKCVLQCPYRLNISIFTLFQFHSFGTKSISWFNFSFPIFFPVIAIQWNQRQTSRSFSWLAFEVIEILNQLYSRIKRRFMMRLQRELNNDDDIQRQVKLLYCEANKLRGTFDQRSPAVKNTLFRAYCMPMYACQLWSKYTQTSMKRLRAAYNNAYRIMYYIPRYISVRPHQVSHCVRTFDAVLSNNLHRFFIRCTSSANFFIRSLQIVWCFLQIFIFPQLFNALVWWRPNAVVVRELFRYLRLISFAFE